MRAPLAAEVTGSTEAPIAPGLGGRIRQSPWFTLAVLTFAFSIGHVDRQLLNLLVQPIKSDFRLSDVEISLLQGVAFSGAYLLMSPVFGRWVDMSGRRNILLGCVIIWSGFTALCGTARGFLSLFAARSMVGAAEAGLTPAAWSMLSDRFDDRRLGRAMGIYNVGTYIGGGMALMLGGFVLHVAQGLDLRGVPLLQHMAPWQLTFLVVGAIGLVAAALLLLVPEPPRRGTGASDAAVSLDTALGIVNRERSFYGLFYLGMALTIVPVTAFPAWLPALAMRQFDVPIATVGIEYGIVSLLGGSIGVLSGPGFAMLLGRMGFRDANLRLGVFTNLIVLACCIALFFRPSYHAVLVIGGVASIFYSMPTPMAATVLQIVTPNRMRGFITSIYIVLVTLVGLCIAPVLVAFFTDVVFADEVRVGDALAIVCAGAALLGALTLYACLRHYRRLSEQPITLAADAD